MSKTPEMEALEEDENHPFYKGKVKVQTLTEKLSWRSPCTCAAGPWRPMKELRVKHGEVLIYTTSNEKSVGHKVKNFIEIMGEIEGHPIAWAEIRRPE